MPVVKRIYHGIMSILEIQVNGVYGILKQNDHMNVIIKLKRKLLKKSHVQNAVLWVKQDIFQQINFKHISKLSI